MIAQILHESLTPTFVIDNNHIITHWNKACERLTGLPAGEMIGTDRQWRAFYRKQKPVLADLVVDKVPKDVAVRHFGNEVQIATHMEGVYEVEVLFPQLGSKKRWIFLSAAPLKDDKGKIIGAVETLQDITAPKQAEADLINAREELEKRVEQRTAELTVTNADLRKEITRRKRVEEELRLSENKFRTVADFTYDWEYWIDLEGSIVYTSPSVERITGYGTKDFNENSNLLASIIHSDDQAEIVRHLNKEMSSEGICHLDFRIITQSGEERWISHFCQPIFDNDGNNLGRRASNRDITKRKQMEVTLRKERETLDRRVKERTSELSSAYRRLQAEAEARQIAYKELQEREEELRKRKEFIETILDNLPIGLAVGSITGGVVTI